MERSAPHANDNGLAARYHKHNCLLLSASVEAGSLVLALSGGVYLNRSPQTPASRKRAKHESFCVFTAATTSSTHTVNRRTNHLRVAPEPLPARLRKWFALLTVFVGLAGQTVHTHEVSASTCKKTNEYAVSSALNRAPDFCPLCIAMQSSHPAKAVGAANPPLLTLLLLLAPTERGLSLAVGYTHRIRPPPLP